jgi:hypothetical protein
LDYDSTNTLAIMSNLLARLPIWFHRDENGGRRRPWYGVAVSFISMLVFCVLVATVSIWKAFLFAGLALVAFGIVECLRPRGGTGDEQETRAATPPPAWKFGLAKSVIDKLPTYAYTPSGTEGGGDLESGSGEPCSVCLEDLVDGEMVRRLPTCKHFFHVECIDMWLHSHTTCPVCRCDLSPPRKITAKLAAVEIEPPTDDALPPV